MKGPRALWNVERHFGWLGLSGAVRPTMQDYMMWVNDTIFGVKMWNKFWNFEGVCNDCEWLVILANTLTKVEYWAVEGGLRFRERDLKLAAGLRNATLAIRIRSRNNHSRLRLQTRSIWRRAVADSPIRSGIEPGRPGLGHMRSPKAHSGKWSYTRAV
jgi:hypothetical protein